ncbi:MAG: hypothetical protein A3E19_06205 [Planctomycetes bacterium RIFCSPHIGHO2_12_FULL_52_36]|nr:MAG: hypothetical protein A3D89_01025 [Planctomycetes bacterium RIFCSPHIGHO2_02_FULL_52_58]OHB93343.1 MAG: hypothetical protein A3E19_06205 [Planctomycetes bacterium RIFCSPHIGHO2_12_FULL_52_36]
MPLQPISREGKGLKVAGLLPTKALVCLLLATFVFSILPDRPVCTQDSFGDQGLLLEMARAGLEAGQYRQAARLCEGILQKDSVNKEANFLLGIAQHYLGEHDLAVEKLQWVLLVDKNNTIAREYLEKSKRKSTSQWSPLEIRLVNTAVQYHEEGLNGLAIGYLKEVLKRNPQNTVAWEALGDVYKKLGNPTVAKAAYHKANAKEKAREIKGEAKYVPKEWWEGLTKKEAKLRDANLKFAEMRERTIEMGGKLSEYDARTEERRIYDAKKMDEKIGRTMEWQTRIEDAMGKLGQPVQQAQPVQPVQPIQPGQQVQQVQVQQGGPGGLVIEEKLLSHRPLLEYELREGEETKLRTQQGTYDEGRSGMAMEFSDKTKEFEEAKSSMESLEEELKNAPLQ